MNGLIILHMNSELIDQADFSVTRFEIDQAKNRKNLHPDLSHQVEQNGMGVLIFHGTIPERCRALRFGLGDPVNEESLMAVENKFRQHNGNANFLLTPFTDPSFVNLLMSHGYSVGQWSQVLVADLQQQSISANKYPGIHIKKIDGSRAKEYADILAQSFATLEVPYLANPAMHIDIPFMENGHSYLASVNDTLAGAATWVNFGEWIYMFIAGTLPGYREQGIQSALIQRRMVDARDAGCRYASIVCGPGSTSGRNAERQGFQVAYTRLSLVKNLQDN